MIRFALKGMLGRKLRTALTAIAIVLGVATVAGTFVLTDSIDKAFDAIFTDIYRGTDATITPKSPFDTGDGSGTSEASFDESLLPTVQDLPEVGDAIGGVASESTLLVKDGKAIVFGGAPNLGFSVDPTKPQFNSLTLVDGEWPGADEVVIDTSTASKKDLTVGSTIGVQVEGPVETLTISGLVKFGTVSSIGGATLSGFDLRTAQRLFDKEGQLDQIRVASKTGVSPAQLVSAIDAVLPPGTEVQSGEAQASEDAAETDEAISFLRYFLLAFGLIALFVGAFVIVNSMSITVAQRTRELATLRTLGASRRQVRRSVVLEAFVMGLLASIVGLFVGLALAKGLFAFFDAVGFTLPNSGLLLEPRTVIVSIALGVVVTVIAGLFPAMRATRVPPIAAVREGAELPPGRFARLRMPFAVGITVLGFGLLVLGLFAHGTTAVLALLIIGTILVFIGVALISAPFIPALAGVLGWPATKLGGAAGLLARDNARRNPRRTASTAAALMIGLALVTLVATLAAGITQTFRGAVNDIFTSDYAITAENNYSPIPIAVGEAAAQAPGVTAAGSVRTGEVLVFGSTTFATAVTPDTGEVVTLVWSDGSQEVFATLGEDGAFVDNDYAEEHGLEVGSTVPVTFINGQTKDFTVEGIFDPPTGGSPFGNVTISAAAWDAQNPQPKDLFTFLTVEGGPSDEHVAAIDAALVEFPNAKLQTREQFIDNQISGLSSVLNILYVLLGLSVIVSLFGIVNTLVLTVFERTREIGMLRAVGMTRRQVRRMIRHESVITALIGALVGMVLGVVLAGILIAKVDFLEFALPVTQLAIFTVAAVIVGIIAAIFPARRAAKLDPLEALQYE